MSAPHSHKPYDDGHGGSYSEKQSTRYQAFDEAIATVVTSLGTVERATWATC